MRAIVIAVLLAAMVLPAAAFEVFDLVPPAGRQYDPTWPPDGSQWHGIYPAGIYCTYGTQTGHDDQNGDGFIDPCENIQIDGVWKHVEWIGPTITIYQPPGRNTLMVEPIAAGRQTEYHVVYPPDAYCTIIDTDQPIEQVCQYIMVLNPPEYAGEWHVEEIGTNIHTNGGSPVDDSTWGKIKSFFRDLLE